MDLNRTKIAGLSRVSGIVLLALFLSLTAHADVIPQSGQTGQNSVPLTSGWNFFSLPMAPANTDIAIILADVSANVKVVWGYDNLNKQWKKWKPGGGASNSLSTMVPGAGYWLYLDNTSGAVSMTGWTLPSSTTLRLYENWNLIGYPGKNDTETVYALSVIPLAWSIVWGWENGQWYGKHASIQTLPSPIQPLTMFNQDKAYWIKMVQATTDWTPPSPVVVAGTWDSSNWDECLWDQ